jgi:RNase P subunit RPR2
MLCITNPYHKQFYNNNNKNNNIIKQFKKKIISILYKMSDALSNKKNYENLIQEYMNNITGKCEKTMNHIKKQIKIDNDNLVIPTVYNYIDMPKYNFNLAQLKSFAKHYKLKLSGNKSELLTRVYSYLYFYEFITKIQKIFRGFLARKYRDIHGPASMNRKLCTNNSDFITMEPVEEINFNQFLSYKDEDGFVYGFDIISLHNLFLKSPAEMKNPYNRNAIPETIFKNIKQILRLSRVFKIHINLHFEDDSKIVSNEKSIELRALGLFQNIDSLGNYSNSEWFLSLNRIQLIKFVRELSDVWNYRAQLSQEIKRNICPPNADPFRNLSMPYIHTESNMWNVRKVILEVMEKMVNTGVDKDSKSLGAYYVLGALTLVNQDAADALPWLFQSLNYY